MMTKYFDDQILHEIESRLDIVELIAENVSLQRKGNRYWGLCPFHSEKTPSFSVSREKQMFYCFGCHAGGNLYSYIMRRDGVEFKEAVEILAQKAGVQVRTAGNSIKQDRRRQVVTLNEAVAQYYHNILLSKRGIPAQKYLQKRGISNDTIEQFKLGYASEDWHELEQYLLKQHVSPEAMKLSGLIRRSENQERYYDLFRDRIIFPIFSYSNDIIGFGGRILGDGTPKYLNTPETDLFSKRHHLYGLAQGKSFLREQNQAILVEGYMDCIQMHQAGIRNVVASLGTAFTREQAVLLARYAEKVIVLYDGDEAGQRETMRAISILAEQGIKPEVVSLPGGKDPDEYLNAVGKKEFLAFIQNNTISHIEFKLNFYMQKAEGVALEDKVRTINELKPDISSLQSVIEQEHYIELIARRLRLNENQVKKELRRAADSSTGLRNKIEIKRDNIQYGKYSIQEKILAAMIRDDEVFLKVQSQVGINFFANPDYKSLAHLYAQLQGGNEKKMQEMNRIAAEEGLEEAYARICMAMESPFPEKDWMVDEFIGRVQQRRMEAMWQQMFNKLEQLEQSGDFNSLLRFILQMDRFINSTREGGIQ